MKINERLRAAREDAELTQDDLAAAIGCTRRQVIRYEQGEQEPTTGRLIALCRALGVSADYLLGLPQGLEWPR